MLQAGGVHVQYVLVATIHLVEHQEVSGEADGLFLRKGTAIEDGAVPHQFIAHVIALLHIILEDWVGADNPVHLGAHELHGEAERGEGVRDREILELREPERLQDRHRGEPDLGTLHTHELGAHVCIDVVQEQMGREIQPLAGLRLHFELFNPSWEADPFQHVILISRVILPHIAGVTHPSPLGELPR